MLSGNKTPSVAMTIACSDPGGGEGIQADLKTFAAHGVYGTSSLTGFTARGNAGHGVEYLSDELVVRQIDVVVEDMGVDAVKTGMLGSASVVTAVARKLAEHHIEKVIVDPVLIPSGGRSPEPKVLDALKAELLPKAYVVTLSLSGAEVLVGFSVADEDSIRGAARQIVEMGAKAVVIQGGLAADDESVDWLYDGRRFSRFAGSRMATRQSYGAACVFSAAITAQLARGAQLEAAVRSAKRYLTAAIERGFPMGRGDGRVDPSLGEAIWPPRS